MWYPKKDVTYMVPFRPSGKSDISARIQQANFRRLFNREMIIQYKPGGGGAVGWSSLQRYPADGYTMMGTNLPHIVLKPLQKGSGFQLEDIVNVHFFHYTPDAIVVPADSECHLQHEEVPEKMQDTLLFWRMLESGRYEVVISDITLMELKQCFEPKRSELLGYLGTINA